VRAGWRIRRLTTGSGIIAKRVRRGFVPLRPDGEVRLLATLARCVPAAYAAPRLLDLAHQSPVWLVGGTGAWCIAAWRARPDKAPAEQPDAEVEAGEDDQAPADEPGAPDPAALRQAVVDQLLGWVGDRRGIHLSEAYERYRELPGHEHLADTQIRAALVDHYRIPVRPAVRTPDGVRAGIHRDDLQPLPSPDAPAPVADDHNTRVTSDVAA
jgi:hypothetical protein